MALQNGHPSPGRNRTVTDEDEDHHRRPVRKKKQGSMIWLYAIFAFLVLAIIVAIVLLRRAHAQTELKNTTQQMAVETVTTVHPEPGSPEVHLVLPGMVQAYIQSTVYAQVTGYLKHWFVDIGAPVQKGQLLAEIETPELDQQLRSAQATQNQNQASVDLAEITADRYNALLHTHSVAQQDVDEKNGDLAVAVANLNAAKANVDRILKTEAFKEVYAPFDGVLTQRRIDEGDLINAGTGSTSQALFQIAQTRTLRVYVQVPEMYSGEMLPGLNTKLDLASSPGVPVTGKLVRTSKAIDPSSLTLTVEVDVDNPTGKLLPGGYAQVHFDIMLPKPPVVLPGNTLIFRAQGTQVGVVGPDNVAHLKDIKMGRDFGAKMEVVDGVTQDDNVILNPSDSLTDGEKVRVDTSNQPKTP